MSSNIAIQRIKREFVEVARFDEVNQNLISIESVNNSLVDLKGKITGKWYLYWLSTRESLVGALNEGIGFVFSINSNDSILYRRSTRYALREWHLLLGD